MSLPRPGRRCRNAALVLGAAAGLAAASAEAAQPSSVEWGLSAGVRHRTLREWSDSGSRLLTERGALPRLQLDAQLAAPRAPALALEAAVTDGRLDYEGRTQSGSPVETTSRHSERELNLLWRPLPAAGWGEAWLGLGWLHTRRAIASSAVVGGLTETSSLLMPGIRWRSPALVLPRGGAQLQLEAQWRASARHRLEVDYLGMFDASSLHGGQRSEAVLRLIAATSSDWRWTVEWSHTRQSPSAISTLYRQGAPIGTVRQPRLGIDDVSLSLTRRF